MSFSGTLRGITEDIHRIKLVLRVEVPLYYYATGQDPLSYQLLLVTFKKDTPGISNLQPKNNVKILARIRQFETRKNSLDKPVGVLHLEALALADRTHKKDFFHHAAPDFQLYQSWKTGRLFFKETPLQILSEFPQEPLLTESVPKQKKEAAATQNNLSQQPEHELIFEEEETFLLKQN